MVKTFAPRRARLRVRTPDSEGSWRGHCHLDLWLSGFVQSRLRLSNVKTAEADTMSYKMSLVASTGGPEEVSLSKPPQSGTRKSLTRTWSR